MPNRIFLKYILSFFLLTSLNAAEIEGTARVVDGDTIEIKNNKIRLFGIDAPESKQLCKKMKFAIIFFTYMQTYNCGFISTQKLKQKIQGKNIKCLYSEKDRYNRILGTCFDRNFDINKWLVRNGYAVAYLRYSKKYLSDQQFAESQKLGIWQGSFDYPENWRKKN